MANYYGMGRSNYVHWHPEKLAHLEYLFPITVVRRRGAKAILSDDEGGTPTCFMDFDDPTMVEHATGLLGTPPTDDLDFIEVVHHAMKPGQVLVWIEIGNEKLRYLTGVAYAIDSNGWIVSSVHLDQIYRTPGVTNPAQY